MAFREFKEEASSGEVTPVKEAKAKVQVTGVERYFDENEIIVSKTDLKGRLTYVNDIFLKISGYEEKNLLGQPHNIIRHPEMPRTIFKLLWQRISNGHEIFAYVNNLAINGDNYWVFAHVTPSKDVEGNIHGYHSSRRVAKRTTLDQVIVPLYKELLAIEGSFANRKEGLLAAEEKLNQIIAEKGVSYDEFILSI